MDNMKISIEKDKQIYNFEIADYVHHESEHCKFEVYRDGEFVAGFEPDNHHYLKVCKNTGMVDEELLYLIADKLETMSI